MAEPFGFIIWVVICHLSTGLESFGYLVILSSIHTVGNAKNLSPAPFLISPAPKMLANKKKENDHLGLIPLHDPKAWHSDLESSRITLRRTYRATSTASFSSI